MVLGTLSLPICFFICFFILLATIHAAKFNNTFIESLPIVLVNGSLVEGVARMDYPNPLPG